MIYLVKSTKMYRCDTESNAQDFLNDLKNKSDVVSSTITKKEKKSKGEVIDTWYRLTVTEVFNSEQDPIDSLEDESVAF